MLFLVRIYQCPEIKDVDIEAFFQEADKTVIIIRRRTQVFDLKWFSRKKTECL